MDIKTAVFKRASRLKLTQRRGAEGEQIKIKVNRWLGVPGSLQRSRRQAVHY